MAAVECTKFFKYCRKIIGLGKNFRIAGEDLSTYPSEPLLFLKAPTTLLNEGNQIQIPPGYGAVTYEVELGVVIGKEGSNISEDKALDHVGGYCVTLDITAMDKIKLCASKGLPWTMGKCWDTFTPISEFIPKESIPDPHDVNMWLKLDGEMKQSGNTKDLYFNIPQVISYTSKVMKLEKGDLFLTGTPAGNGTCTSGQILECGFEGIRGMKFAVA